TEKPKTALKIARFLDKNAKVINNDPLTLEINFKGEKAIILSALGHLLNLETTEKGYPAFKTEWKPIKGVQEKYLKNACYWLKKADKIFIATDYDIEGELIAFNILKYCNALNKEIKRVKFSSLTKEEIIKAFSNPISIDKNLVAAGITRHLIDWFYGINFSRALMSALWKQKIKDILSIGRVQGAILRLIYDREKEIENFKSKYYWIIKIKDENNIIFTNNKKFEKEEDAKKYFEKVNKKEGIIKKIELKKEKINPFPNFSLVDLQEESYKLFKINPSKTLKILQSLYENGYISYPRTSSQKLPNNQEYLSKILNKLAVIYKEAKQFINKKPVQGKKEDPAHPAIHPTGVIPKNLSKEEQLIYELIVKRFLASFSEPIEIISQKITLVPINTNEEFYYQGKKIIKKGFLEIYNYYNIEENFLDYKEGQKLKIKAILEKNKTKPPSRYNQGQLIKVLEQKKIGTKATRAQILDVLYKRGYLKGNNTIYITPLGKKVVEIMINYLPKIVDLEMTRELEEALEKIQEGKENPKEVLKKNMELVRESALFFKEKEDEIGKVLAKEKEKTKEEKLKESIIRECDCGGFLIIKESKQGKKFIACTNWPKCKKTFSIPEFKRLLKRKCPK
ncbi:MAG: DNA topoisomerase I, partial [Nanoarchaeota archaeon]